MAKIVKIQWNNINGGTDRTDIYPVTSDNAVYNADNKTIRQVIRERGVVNISTYFSYDGTPEKLALETALKKITEENRCPGFLATILTAEDEWWTFRYNAYKVDDTTWNNTDNWSPFHTGRLKTDTASEDPETPLHLEWIVKNYIYTLKGWINAVSADSNGYFTAGDYRSFVQALADIESLQSNVSELQEAVRENIGNIAELQEAVKENISNISDLQDAVKTNISDISNLQEAVKENISNISDLYSNVNSLQGAVTVINSSISNINAEIESLKDNLESLQIATVVQSLPTSNINTNTIYLVPAANQENLNMYAEYVYANGSWEKLGEMQLEVDLSGYLKTADLDEEVEKYGYIKSSDLPTSVTTLKAESGSDILTSSPSSATSGNVTVKYSIDENALKNWIENNISVSGSSGVTSISCIGDDNLSLSVNSPTGAVIITGGINTEKLGSDVGPYAVPDVHTSVTNPNGVYFTSNQFITGSVNGDCAITFYSSLGVKGAEVQMILQAGSDGAVISIQGNSVIVTDEYSSITVGAGKYVEINAIFDGNNIYVRSGSK